MSHKLGSKAPWDYLLLHAQSEPNVLKENHPVWRVYRMLQQQCSHEACTEELICAGGDVGYCKHAVHAAAGVRAGRVPVVPAYGLLRHLLLERLHVYHRLLRLLCPSVRCLLPP